MELIVTHAILNAELVMDQIIINAYLVKEDLFFMLDNVSLNAQKDSIKKEIIVINVMKIVHLAMDIAKKTVIHVLKINSSLKVNVLILALMDSLLTMLINAKNAIKNA